MRTPTAERLRDLLTAAGLGRASPGRTGSRWKEHRSQVGEIAAENGVVLHELRTDASLEQIFLELTGGEEASS